MPSVRRHLSNCLPQSASNKSRDEESILPRISTLPRLLASDMLASTFYLLCRRQSDLNSFWPRRDDRKVTVTLECAGGFSLYYVIADRLAWRAGRRPGAVAGANRSVRRLAWPARATPRSRPRSSGLAPSGC